MFWAYNSNSPQIDIILCKEDLTLQELLDQENVLQELKAQNIKLVEFLLKPEILRELVTLITTEPSSDLNEAEQYKYPNLACELLTSDLPAINERLASEDILNKLYCFLQNDPPLNPLLSSYFSRTLSILISRKSEQNWYSYQYTCLQALEFLKAKEEFIELLFRHMGTSSIMDLMHNLVTLIEGPELKQSLRGWLQNQNVIPNLVSLLSPNIDVDCQVNAASALCSIIQKLRENAADLNEKPESDPILNLLESTQTIELVLCTSFSSENVCETSIESAIEVLMTLMQPHLPGESRCRQMLHYSVHDKLESGLTAQSIYTDTPSVKSCHTLALSDIILAILPYIKKMKDILQNPVKTEPITLTSGIISPPFGRARLVVAKFIAVLISLSNAAINKEIILCDIPELLLDLFYAYSSNNFLHTEVEKLIAYAIDNLNGFPVTESKDDDDNDAVIFVHLLRKCNLLQRVLDIWNENTEREKEGKYRKGYMGHLIRIASFIHIEDAKMSTFHDLLVKEVSDSCLNEWNPFVNEYLKFIMEIHSSCLGGVRPKSCQSSDNSFEESSYKEPKLFKEYDPEEDQSAIFMNDQSTVPYGLNNDVLDDEQERQSDLFNVICSQKWPSFVEGLDDIDENESEENNRMNVWKTELRMDGDIRVWGSDDEYGDEDRENTSDPWLKVGNVSDPWAESSRSSDEANWNVDTSWANFDENFSGGATNASDCRSPASSSPSSSSPSSSPSPSPMTTNAESYRLFAGSIRENSTLLNKFSTMHIGDDREDDFFGGSGGEGSAPPFESDAEMVNGVEWSRRKDENVATTVDDANNSFNDLSDTNNSFDMSTQYSCFDSGSGKDSLDEMLNLESICGNTLAEKIANAENDIRNKGLQEQRCALQSNFLTIDSCRNITPNSHTSSSNSNNDGGGDGNDDDDEDESVSGCRVDVACNQEEYYDENRVDRVSGDPSAKGLGNGEWLSTEENFCIAGSSLGDCLTENSVDFVTAENNSTSDAESSVEFGDADNSLEFDMDDCLTVSTTVTTSSPIAFTSTATTSTTTPTSTTVTSCDISGDSMQEQMAAVGATTAIADDACGHETNANVVSSDGNEYGETLGENVPIDDNNLGDKCNNGATKLENDTTMAAALQKTHSLANGDVADSDSLIDCDTKEEDVSSMCNPTSEQSNEDSGTVLTDPA